MDTQRRRTAAQTSAARTVQLLRQCYQRFLLHLFLSLCVTIVLLLSSIGFSAFLPKIPGYLQSAVLFLHYPDMTHKTAQTTLSQAVMEYALFLPTGSGDRYISTPSDKPQTHTSVTARPIARMYIKDGDAPTLEKPSLSQTIQSLPAENGSNRHAIADRIGIRTTDLSLTDQHTQANGGILFSNQTSYPVSAADCLHSAYPIPAPSVATANTADDTSAAAPLVLILHTHGTEAYAPDGAASVPADYTYRTEDTAENVVSVGAVLAETLRAAGIPVLHCTEMFDAASYNDSYPNAAAYIRRTVAAYPSIAYIFDVHRDALAASDGSMLRPITAIGEEVCAQVMSVVGTDDAGGDHPDWRDNLTVAVQLQKRLNDTYPALARPINLRSATFNAQYAKGSLLLEIGAAGNSVAEARSAAYHLGLVLAEMIRDP